MSEALSNIAPVDGRTPSLPVLADRSFMPREFPVPDLRKWRDGYLAESGDLTRLRLLDTKIEMVAEGRQLLHEKAIRLNFALVLLVLAICLVAASLIGS